jgi:hypothetical protein
MSGGVSDNRRHQSQCQDRHLRRKSKLLVFSGADNGGTTVVIAKK